MIDALIQQVRETVSVAVFLQTRLCRSVVGRSTSLFAVCTIH